MALWTDVVTPAELTGYARAALEDYERAKGTLARWLPNRFVPDIVARFVNGGAGMSNAAEYRSYDAESSIGSLPGGARTTIELPPIGWKLRVSEYDQLRARGLVDGEQVLSSIERATRRVTFDIVDRLEFERGKAIENAAYAINENEFILSGSWSRAGGHTVTAGVLWSTPATATPLSDLSTWRDVYVASNGAQPEAILTSTKVVAALSRTAEFRALAATVAGTPSIVTRETVSQVLTAFGLPPIYVYDRQIKKGGTTAKVLTDTKLFYLPAPVDPNAGEASELGATFWGQTLESQEPEYGIAPADQPGLVVGALKTRDPIAVWVHGAAIGLPGLANPNLSLVATVSA